MTALGLDLNLWPTIPMHNHSPTRGRRRVVDKFTIREGFWMLGLVGAILMGIMLLFLFWVSECRHALRDTCLATALSSVPMIVQERKEKLGHAIRLGLIE